jgi:hypothetical protein
MLVILMLHIWQSELVVVMKMSRLRQQCMAVFAEIAEVTA